VPRLAHPDLEEMPDSKEPSLTWMPKMVLLSDSGTFAVSTGPYILKRENAKESDGFFLTIWKLESGGQWKVTVTVRTKNPPVQSGPDDFRVLALPRLQSNPFPCSGSTGAFFSTP